MATQVEAAALPAASFTKEELDRMFEFAKIVQFRDRVTSGTHPRIKVPPHLVPAGASSGVAPGATTTTSTATTGNVRGSDETHEDVNRLARQNNNQPHLARVGGTGASSAAAAAAAAVDALPGLGYASRQALDGKPHGGVGSVLPGEVDMEDGSEVSRKRARIEASLAEQVVRHAQTKKASEDMSFPDFILEDVLQKALALEATFTPPPVAAAAAVSLPASGGTNGSGGVAAAAAGTTGASSDHGSPDDKTFYSSNFSTPEFGLTSRVPVESGEDDGDVSMHDSSDYEPELDAAPSPAELAQPILATQQGHQGQPKELQLQQQQQQQGHVPQAQNPVQANDHYYLDIPSPVLERAPGLSSSNQGNTTQPDAAGFPQRESSRSGGPSAGDFQSTDAGPASSGESSYQRQPADGAPRQPSPFVRTHNLSPVAPQPVSMPALAVATQLPLAIPESQPLQQQQQQQQQQRPRTPSLGTAPQVALLRREQVRPLSSPDSSSQGQGQRIAEQRKGKKRNSNANNNKNKRKPASPRIKVEPKSPSPILAPQRPYKRQRQAAAGAAAAVAAAATRKAPQMVYDENDEDDEYSPVMHPVFAGNRAPHHAPPQPVVYERTDRRPSRYEHPSREAAVRRSVSLQQRYPARDYEVYEARPGGYAPQYVPSAQPAPGGGPPPPPPHLTQYVQPPSRAEVRLEAAPGGYPMRPMTAAGSSSAAAAAAVHGSYPGVYEPTGRMSVRPEPSLLRGQSRSPVLMVQSSSRAAYPRHHHDHHQQGMSPPTPTRIVVDEFGREYYEPARPVAARPQQGAATAPRPQRYASEVVYERTVPHHAPYAPHQLHHVHQSSHQPPPLSVRAGSQMPPPPPSTYEEDNNRGILYAARPSPTFAVPTRRVVTQPEYVAPRDHRSGYDQQPERDYYHASPHLERRMIVDEAPLPPPPPPPPVREYMVRAATARPPEPVRYEAVPATMPGRYVERVGSVRPAGGAAVASPRGYEYVPSGYPYGAPQPPVAGAYHEGQQHHRHEGMREYSVRPQAPPHVVVQRAYSVRPGTTSPYYVEEQQQQAPPPPPAGVPFAHEYVYANNDDARRDVYR
ncbi:hypothetical protein SPI_07675 [Niveomyces insectorum RCEF 264]|uniref:Uncharacterized protein n=1 Tax=Niveomyces insectorum RCEF 264 TaxID=1081102 RepID=A0A167PHS8_9HYPO|nr:hypothetical protein SPI_07675 [Niveomyces insectorum RCEF 264]